MQVHIMMIRFVALSVGAVLAAGWAATLEAGTVTPVSSSVDLDAQVTAGAEGITPATATDPETKSQGATINTLSVTTSATSTGGGSVSASGTLTSSWSSASAGTLKYLDMIIHITNAFTGFYTHTDLKDWRYTFQANANGTFDLNYQASQSSTFGAPLENSWRFVWDNGTGPTYSYFGGAVDPTLSGTFSRPIQAGQTYTVGIDNSWATNFAGPFSFSQTQTMNATFDWSISATAVPEPSSLVSLGLAVMAYGLGGLGRRRSRISLGRPA